MNFKEKFKNQLQNYLNKQTLKKNNKKQKKMDKEMEVIPKYQPTFKKVLLKFVHRVLMVVFRLFFIMAYGRKGKKMPPIRDLVLLESATSIAHKIRTKKLTSVQVLNSFIERIKEINPLLNCVVDERYDAALKEAAEADALINSKKMTEEQLAKDKPFLGVPISTKDCIMVKDMLNTAGLWARRNIRAKEDADAIALMRIAGAIPFALTNVSECCMWWESYNKVHGRTSNAYDTNRMVGGSSGGEGCLQSAGGSAFGIGSDIGGSIRIPAFFNGIFGHKPSKFIVSNEGQHPKPISMEQNSFLSIGPMCRFACDLKPMLQILADKNATSLYLDEHVELKNVRFFYQEDDGGGDLVSLVDPDIKKSMEKVVKHLKNTVKADVKKIQINKLRKSTKLWIANMKSNDSVGFDVLLMNSEGKLNLPWEFFKWFLGQSKYTFVGLMTVLVEFFGIKYGSKEHLKMVEEKRQLYQEFKEILGNDGVFLYPVHPTVAPYHSEALIRAFNFGYTGIFNILGLPVTSIPLGLGKQGLPLGIQAVAGMNQDRLCLAVACELERAFGGWVSPEVEA